ncbi:hypothetical protein N7490_001869 [Penicillium lividum]|nr:hypothetical protein N7490_001869 [Penicillium lividum]
MHQAIPTPGHSEPDGNVRKRVCKACDRCRLKKSRCDGSSPCLRCRGDNAICVFGERQKAHDKVYPKRYVEMLEQQQAWLVCGLQELYRQAIDGEGWPRKPLNPVNGGYSLLQDLLTHLGALDPSKGERFEENPEAMQEELWGTNSQVQYNEFSKCSPDSDQSPVARSCFSSVAIPCHAMPLTPPIYNPTVHELTFEPELQMPTNPQFDTQSMLMQQSVVSTLALQGNAQRQCGNTEINPFDIVDLFTRADSMGVSLGNQEMFSSMSYLQAPINCMSTFSHMDLKNDCDDFDEFLNLNPTESISK